MIEGTLSVIIILAVNVDRGKHLASLASFFWLYLAYAKTHLPIQN